METLYLITDYDELNGVLDISQDLDITEELFPCYHKGYKETHIFKLKFDKSKYEYDRDYYKLEMKNRETNETIDEDSFKENGIVLQRLLTPIWTY